MPVINIHDIDDPRLLLATPLLSLTNPTGEGDQTDIEFVVGFHDEGHNLKHQLGLIFRNTDPRGSLSANVTSTGVRCLSNMPLDEMLEDRHRMSQTVREDVSPKSTEWGYKLGSTYIRKVHFRDANMNAQIQEKVVNRLRQVTSAIKQDGDNQVQVITSSAKRKAAVAFANSARVASAAS